MIGRCTKKEYGDIEIKLSHEHFEPIVFYRVLRYNDVILLAAKIKVVPRNLIQEGAHTATLEGRISKKMVHQVTGNTGHQLMADTAKYYGECYSSGNKMFKLFFGEDQTEKHPYKNEDTSKNPVEWMYLNMSSIRHESLCRKRHWAMLVGETISCKHSFFLEMNSDEVDMISFCLKGLKDKYKIQI